LPPARSRRDPLVRPAAAARLAVIASLYLGIVVLEQLQPFAVLSALSVVLLGFLLSTLLPVMHEAAHGHLGGSRLLNDVIGRIAGALLTVNYTLYKRYHLEHHARLGGEDDPELPVELTGIRSYLSYLGPKYFLIPFWRQQLRIALGERPSFVGGASSLRAVHLDQLLVAAWTVAILALLVAWPRAVTLYYLLPLWLAAAWMFLTTVPEHYRIRDVAGTLTRSVLSGQLMSFFLWNTNYHVQHHENPAIPFEELPRRQTRWRSDQAEVAPSFTTFHLELIGSLWRTGRGG
jgi:fatty acid desaturase